MYLGSCLRITEVQQKIKGMYLSTSRSTAHGLTSPFALLGMYFYINYDFQNFPLSHSTFFSDF